MAHSKSAYLNRRTEGFFPKRNPRTCESRLPPRHLNKERLGCRKRGLPLLGLSTHQQYENTSCRLQWCTGWGGSVLLQIVLYLINMSPPPSVFITLPKAFSTNWDHSLLQPFIYYSIKSPIPSTYHSLLFCVSKLYPSDPSLRCIISGPHALKQINTCVYISSCNLVCLLQINSNLESKRESLLPQQDKII